MSDSPRRACSRDRRVVRTREALLEALLELTLENGYGRTRVRHVLERAGVARSTFYSHFADKDDLLLGGFTLFRLEPGADRADGLLPLPDVTRIFAHTGLYADLYRALRDGGDLELLTARVRADLGASLTRVFADLVARGHRLAGAPDFLARFFAGAFVAVLYDWLEAGAPGDPRDMAARFEDLVRRGASGG